MPPTKRKCVQKTMFKIPFSFGSITSFSMASSHSSSLGTRNDGYAARSLDPEQSVVSVMPLNSVPYSCPPPSSTPIQNEPAMMFLPSHTTEEELERAVAATSHGVAVTGVAALGKLGCPIGSIDILESNDTYMFCIALPGVAWDEKTFSWYIEPNGKIFIKGVTTTGEKEVFRHNMVFEMLTQNLCPGSWNTDQCCFRN